MEIEAMVDWLLAAATFIHESLVSWMFGILVFSFIVYVIRLHLSNGKYQNFYLAQMIMRGDGTLDRKAFKEAILFLLSMYGFVFVMHKHSDLIIAYFWAMAVVWLGAHAIDNKLPTLGGRPLGQGNAPHPESDRGDLK